MTNGSSTSEFRLTVMSQFIAMALVSLGLINPTEVDDLAQHILILLGGISTTIISAMYIYSRMRLKVTELETSEIQNVG